MTNLDSFEERIVLEKCVSDLSEAILLGDRRSLMKLTADGLTWGHSTGVVEDKEEFVNNIASRIFNFTAIDIQNQTIVLHENTGVVRHVMVAETNHAGEDKASIKIGVILVWYRGLNKDWRLLARQAYKL